MKGDRRVRFPRKQATVDVCVRITFTVIALISAAREEPYLPVTGCEYVLICSDCSDQTGHNSFKIRYGRSP